MIAHGNMDDTSIESHELYQKYNEALDLAIPLMYQLVKELTAKANDLWVWYQFHERTTHIEATLHLGAYNCTLVLPLAIYEDLYVFSEDSNYGWNLFRKEALRMLPAFEKLVNGE